MGVGGGLRRSLPRAGQTPRTCAACRGAGPPPRRCATSPRCDTNWIEHEPRAGCFYSAALGALAARFWLWFLGGSAPCAVSCSATALLRWASWTFAPELEPLVPPPQPPSRMQGPPACLRPCSHLPFPARPGPHCRPERHSGYGRRSRPRDCAAALGVPFIGVTTILFGVQLSAHTLGWERSWLQRRLGVASRQCAFSASARPCCPRALPPLLLQARPPAPRIQSPPPCCAGAPSVHRRATRPAGSYASGRGRTRPAARSLRPRPFGYAVRSRGACPASRPLRLHLPGYAAPVRGRKPLPGPPRLTRRTDSSPRPVSQFRRAAAS